MNNKYIIIAQALFLIVVFSGIFIFYPQVHHTIEGNVIKFSSENAEVIIISKSEDFSNPRYITFENKDESFVMLDPGTYYFKPANSFIEGFAEKIEIPSEVSLDIKRNATTNESEIENAGNVKIKVSKNERGVMVGQIILNPEERETIEDKGVYQGSQT